MNEDLTRRPAYHDPERPYMSMHDRAAQFMPFKSLNGYHEQVADKESTVLDAKWQQVEYDSTDEFLPRDRDFLRDDDGDDAGRVEK